MKKTEHSTSTLPVEAEESLSAFGIDSSGVLAFAKTDLDLEQSYTEGWAALTSEALVILDGESSGAYPLADLEELKAENLVSSGLLSAKVKGEERILCRYSNSQIKDVSRLARLAEKLKKGEEVGPQELAEDETDLTCPKCGRRYPDPLRPVCPKCLDRGSIFLRLLKYFSAFRGPTILILVCMAAQAGLELFAPYLNGRIFFDEVLDPDGSLYRRIIPVLGTMLGIRIVAIGISIIYGRLISVVGARVIFALKNEIFVALQRLSLGFFNRKQTGALMNRINYDALRLEFFFVEGAPFFIVNFFIIIGISATMIVMNWQLALLVFIPAPLLILVTKKLMPRVWAMYSRRYRSRRRLNAQVNDSFSGVRVVKAFGREKTEIRRFGVANTGLFGANLAAQQLSATVFPLINLVVRIGGFVVWGVGGWQAIHGRISLGTLVTFTGYIMMFYRPMQFFTRLLDFWAMCMNSAQRIFEVVDTRPEIEDKPNPVSMPELRGKVQVKGVTFAYEPNKPVLHEVSLKMKPGQMVGLVGHTGAGKSTITNLITRLYDVESGEITIDGVNVKDIALKDLRGQIGIVLQQTYLFNGTVAENIAYARPEASREEIIRAAEAANAHDFVVKLPDGYDTLLGRQGQDLSGGERQRISIARAILKDPRILIFDEATSSVDTETEERIQQAIFRLVEGRTTIAIAHRLSTLRRADMLYIVEKGKIIESGTHEKLMESRGKYRELVNREKKALKVIGVGE